jgi:PEP-CTERM motif
MNRLFKLFALGLLSLGFAASAQAAYIPASWTDSIDFGNGQYVGNQFKYSHDLTNEGFQIGRDRVTSIELSIELVDNARDDRERAKIKIPSMGMSDEAPIGSTWNFSYDGTEFGGWAILGLWQLNLTGMLSVVITSIQGDFNLMSSQLMAHGLTGSPNSVPEPGVLGLLGMGLLGIALSARRRKVTQR